MLRTLQAADIAGIRAFAAHAKADEARGFYLKFDFISSPSDPMHFFVLLNDVLQNCFLNLAIRSKATNALVKLVVAHQMGNF